MQFLMLLWREGGRKGEKGSPVQRGKVLHLPSRKSKLGDPGLSICHLLWATFLLCGEPGGLCLLEVLMLSPPAEIRSFCARNHYIICKSKSNKTVGTLVKKKIFNTSKRRGEMGKSDQNTNLIT